MNVIIINIIITIIIIIIIIIMNVNYQFVESLKRHQASKPENFTKLQALNTLIQTQS